MVYIILWMEFQTERITQIISPTYPTKDEISTAKESPRYGF